MPAQWVWRIGCPLNSRIPNWLSTRLKVFGEGDWKVRKHGNEKQREWRMLHLAVDPVNQAIVSARVSLDHVHDAEGLPTLLRLRSKLRCVYAIGAYDSRASHPLITRKGRQPAFRLARARGYGKRDTQEMKRSREGLVHWKKISGGNPPENLGCS
ncbi:transposase [Aeromonas sp. HMWF014]|uniref:transposase n=1 Tax=Aeromonas sp. HMWF014 TaxID=2056850 RepID=UPI0035C1F76B